MAVHPLNVLSLCTGYGGIELGLQVAGVPTRTICCVEREAYAAAILAQEMGQGAMDAAPIWSDLVTFDGKPWRGVVDLVTAGFPCQPWSCAGLRRGVEDERWIWPAIARIIRDVAPGYVFLENVPALVLGGGLALVLGDLAALGFDAEWDLFSAGAMGAPHKRERIFILAHARRGGHYPLEVGDPERTRRKEPRLAGRGTGEEEGRAGTDNRSERPGSVLGNAHGEGHAQWQGERCDDGEERSAPERASGEVAHAERVQSGQSAGTEPDERLRPTGEGAGLGIFPPGPGDRNAWRAILDAYPELAPATQSPLRGVAHGPALRMDRLRAAGNGVVPLAAAVAFRVLADRITRR